MHRERAQAQQIRYFFCSLVKLTEHIRAEFNASMHSRIHYCWEIECDTHTPLKIYKSTVDCNRDAKLDPMHSTNLSSFSFIFVCFSSLKKVSSFRKSEINWNLEFHVPK